MPQPTDDQHEAEWAQVRHHLFPGRYRRPEPEMTEQDAADFDRFISRMFPNSRTDPQLTNEVPTEKSKS